MGENNHGQEYHDFTFLDFQKSILLAFHEQFLEELDIALERIIKLECYPTKYLRLNISDIDNLLVEMLIKYLKNGYDRKVYVDVSFNKSNIISHHHLEILTDVLFKNFRVVNLTVKSRHNHLYTSEFYERVKNCPSIQYVNLSGDDHLNENAFDAIKSCSNVKQWRFTLSLSCPKNLRSKLQ